MQRLSGFLMLVLIVAAAKAERSTPPEQLRAAREVLGAPTPDITHAKVYITLTEDGSLYATTNFVLPEFNEPKQFAVAHQNVSLEGIVATLFWNGPADASGVRFLIEKRIDFYVLPMAAFLYGGLNFAGAKSVHNVAAHESDKQPKHTSTAPRVKSHSGIASDATKQRNEPPHPVKHDGIQQNQSQAGSANVSSSLSPNGPLPVNAPVTTTASQITHTAVSSVQTSPPSTQTLAPEKARPEATPKDFTEAALRYLWVVRIGPLIIVLVLLASAALAIWATLPDRIKIIMIRRALRRKRRAAAKQDDAAARQDEPSPDATTPENKTA